MSVGRENARGLRGAYATARDWVSANWTMLANTSALAGTTIVTSLLGFVYWSVAARLFDPAAVGLASAGISAMALLGTVGMVGLGTLMISELPRRTHERGPLLTASLLVSVVASALLWGVLALGARFTGWGGDLAAVLVHPLFALGITLTAAGQVLDEALIGVLRGALQLWRNFGFAVAKLLILVGLGVVVASAGEVEILASWVLGLVLSFGLVAAFLVRERTRFAYRPDLRLLRSLRVATLKHHTLNLALYGPRHVLPVLVAILVSADANAAFYAAWMLVNFAFMVPAHFSTVLHAIGSGDVAMLADRLKFSLRTSLLLGLVAGLGLLVTAPILLGIFGSFYASEATGSLRILLLAIPFVAVKLHLVAVERVHDRIGRMAIYMTAGGLLEVGLSAYGAVHGGIAGLSIGFVVATAIQAAFAAPALLRAWQGRTRPAVER